MVSTLVIEVSPNGGNLRDVSERRRSQRATPGGAIVGAVVLVAVAVTACGASGGTGEAAATSPVSPTSAPTRTPIPSSSNSPSTVATAPPVASAPAPGGVVLTQPWATAALTDVRTGHAFRVADHVADGKVVFLEPMAVWCSKCREQQRVARDAFAGLDPAQAVWVGLDVELSESADNLAEFADRNEFPFTYAVSSVDLSRALAAEFGDGVLSPPNVNVIVVRPDGSVEHMTGQHSADELVAIATAASD